MSGSEQQSNGAERLAPAIGLAIAIAAAGVLAQGAKLFPQEQILRGAALYAANCETCHGVRLAGPPWATDLRKFPLDNPARFVDSVTHGVRNMPPWGDVLKADEIEALWAYVAAGEPRE